MSGNSKRYLEASGEWELVDILGETSILQFGIDEWDIITFWVSETGAPAHEENSLVIIFPFKAPFPCRSGGDKATSSALRGQPAHPQLLPHAH